MFARKAARASSGYKRPVSSISGIHALLRGTIKTGFSSYNQDFSIKNDAGVVLSITKGSRINSLEPGGTIARVPYVPLGSWRCAGNNPHFIVVDDGSMPATARGSPG